MLNIEPVIRVPLALEEPATVDQYVGVGYVPSGEEHLRIKFWLSEEEAKKVMTSLINGEPMVMEIDKENLIGISLDGLQQWHGKLMDAVTGITRRR